ncbi:MAG TPA: undecaprenyl-diphosphate phosphatase [Solirubrobacteraceae bacterium]|nr:undecaprenyl-diphosphate phosphatase [Solirubrobacteraceae bacterium]
MAEPAGSPRATQATELRLHRALLLGLVQGATEVLPVSSSAHIALLPRLAGWPHVQRDAELRNSLEVALHAGTAVALALALRGELGQALRALDGRALAPAALALALAPPALAGYLLERRLERRPSGPRALATGLAVGAAAMAWADTRPGTRNLADFGPRDGLALGLAQALALLPGVSRNGATLTAARARGFAREDAHALSWRVGLPVIAGAAVLKASRLGQRRTSPGAAPTLVAGAGAAFLSTLAGAPLIRPGRRGWALWPFALYRAGLALAAVGCGDRQSADDEPWTDEDEAAAAEGRADLAAGRTVSLDEALREYE